MKLIEPVALTDAQLVASDVPEDDYQEWVAGTAYAVGDNVMVATSTADIHKNYECVGAIGAGLTPDLLDDNCNTLTGWTDGDTYGGETSVSPAGQFKFDSGTDTLHNGAATIYRTISSPPNTHTIEIKTYFDALGTDPNLDDAVLVYSSATWALFVIFQSTGLFVTAAGGTTAEVGTDIVKCNTEAEWQTWRFEVDKTTPSSATVAVYLKNSTESSFTLIDTVACDYEDSFTNGQVFFSQRGGTTEHRITHVDYIKIATGLGQTVTSEDSPHLDTTNWLKISATNRWKAFDEKVGSQTSQAEAVTFVIAPGTAVDAMGFLGIAADTIDIVEIDTTGDLVTNGTAWTGATGTTQPTSWDKVGTPADYAIDGGMVKITTDAVNEGMSQTIAVTAATEYQLVGIYKNTAADIAQIAVYDVTHSADILATTDLASSTVNSPFSNVFTTPAGCVSVKISFLGKASGDIVWFDTVRLAPTAYNETINMVPTGSLQITTANVFDLVSSATAVFTLTFAYSGGTVLVGGIIYGVQAYLGQTLYGSTTGIHDYSVKQTDDFGVADILERDYSNRMALDFLVETASKNYVSNLLASYRATLILYVGDEDDPTLITYGFPKDWSMATGEPGFAIVSIDIEGLT